MKLQVATCQFPTSSDTLRNARHVMRQMREAKQAGAHVAHFCEGSLSGYAGADLHSFAGFDWEVLTECTQRVIDLAGELGLWVIVGSSHPLSGRHKPHNSVYVIDDRGRIVDRYDKLFCSGDRAGKLGDLAHYSAGDHFVAFTIRGVRCGVLICYDFRFPELYREYKKKGVELMFHSYHAGNISPSSYKELQDQVGAEHHRENRGSTLPAITMPSSMQAAAGANYVWISCANTSAKESCWPSFFVRPDGVITGRLRRNVSGVLLSTVDTRKRFYDSTADWRGRAMRGVYHTGRVVKDARSTERKRL